MSKIVAIKDGKEISFSIVAWNLLGKDKSGYTIVPTEATKKQAAADAKKSAEPVSANPIGETVKTSSDFTIDNAIKALKQLKTVEEVLAFTKDEVRPSFLPQIEKFKESLVVTEEVVAEVVAEEVKEEETTEES